jgi:hypothetical protein
LVGWLVGWLPAGPGHPFPMADFIIHGDDLSGVIASLGNAASSKMMGGGAEGD